MSKKIVITIGFMFVTASAFALSRHDARVAKERLARCQYNDAVCTGHVLIDAMVAAGQDQGGNRPPTYQEQKVIVIHSTNDRCGGSSLGTIVFTYGQLQSALDACNSLPDSRSWSVSVDGVCTDVEDGSAKSVCNKTVAKVNSERN